jgi:hypothetical protein
MRRALAVAVVLGSVVRGASGEVQVQASADRLDVSARDAPLTQILDRIAEKTGMLVEYGESRPSRTVTATLQGLSPAEAVLAILEGQRLNYALVMDRDGVRVAKLLLLGEAPAGGATAKAGEKERLPAPPPMPRERRAPAVGPEEGENEEPVPPEEESPAQLEAPARARPQSPAEPAPPGGLGFRSAFPRSAFTPGLPTAPAPASPAAGQPAEPEEPRPDE